MNVVKIHIDTFIYPEAHHREAFGREAVGAGDIGAGVPFYAREINPGVIRQRIQPGSDNGASGGRGPIRMVVGFIEMRVVVKILKWSVSRLEWKP